MQGKSDRDVIIIGGGLTGLTAGWYLRKRGLDVVVLEKESTTGGVIKTFSEDGFVYEAGPNTGVLSRPEVAELFEGLAGQCKLEIADPGAKRRLIWKSGRWHALPGGLAGAVRTPLFTTFDKLRILGEPFRRKADYPFETVAGLVRRRLGRSYLDYAVDPFISGIYAGDPEKLVTRYALPRLYALEQNWGSFIRGAVMKKIKPADERMKRATGEVFSAEGGLASLTGALAKGIGAGRIILNSKDVSVRAKQKGFVVCASTDGNQLEMNAKSVVSTVDGGVIPELFPFADRADLSAIAGLEYSGVTQVVLGFKKWNGMDLNAFGGLVPSREKRNILGVLFTSSFLKNRAPEEGAVLSVFIGGARRSDLVGLSDEVTKALVFQEMEEMLGVKDPSPEICRIFRYKRAIPQYGVSTKERLEAIGRIEGRYPGLYLAGAIRDGIGMADRISQAKTIAGDVAVRFGRSLNG